VQYIIKGGELVDWVLKSELKEDGAYLLEKDFQYYHPPVADEVEGLNGAKVEGETASSYRHINPSAIQPLTRIYLKAGYFGVFFPEDGHRPKLNDGIHKGVLKAVVKINRALLG